MMRAMGAWNGNVSIVILIRIGLVGLGGVRRVFCVSAVVILITRKASRAGIVSDGRPTFKHLFRYRINSPS